MKGVGEYTAAAVASFAFGEKVAVVDGNVYRVLARLFGMEEDIANTKDQKVFRERAKSLLPDQNIGDYNQAIMEFGAMHCKPANPDCLFCPFSDFCVARKLGKQGSLPFKSKKVKVRERFFHYLVFGYEGKILLKERKAGDVWQGLFDFPLIEKGEFEEHDRLLDTISSFAGANTENLAVEDESKLFTHILSHQKLQAKFFSFELNSEKLADILTEKYNGSFYDIDEIKELPKPVLILKFLNKGVY